MKDIIKGYKVFNPDWTCRGYQFTCPGVFEEDVIPEICNRGFHFCKKAVDCFYYYAFDPNNKVAEVVALGEVVTEEDKFCTNKLQIVREIPWGELLTIVNTGARNTGYRNTGNCNTGNCNTGNYNTGDCNTGNYNTGDCNTGHANVGYYNTGNHNTGSYNVGNRNVGRYNTGSYNTGYWNQASFSSGCFCTKTPKIMLFDNRSDWTMNDWLASKAHEILSTAPGLIKWVPFFDMTDEDKAAHPEAEITGGYLRERRPAEMRSWWRGLSRQQQNIITSIPNFDSKIFKKITGIDVTV